MVMNSHRKVFPPSTLCWGTKQIFFFLVALVHGMDLFLVHSLYWVCRSLVKWLYVRVERKWEVSSETANIEWSLEFVFLHESSTGPWISKLRLGNFPQNERCTSISPDQVPILQKFLALEYFFLSCKLKVDFKKKNFFKLSRTFSWFLCEHA